MACLPRAHHVIVRGSCVTAGVPGNYVVHASNLSEDGFHTPKAAACKYGCLVPF